MRAQICPFSSVRSFHSLFRKVVLGDESECAERMLALQMYRFPTKERVRDGGPLSPPIFEVCKKRLQIPISAA